MLSDYSLIVSIHAVRTHQNTHVMLLELLYIYLTVVSSTDVRYAWRLQRWYSKLCSYQLQ